MPGTTGPRLGLVWGYAPGEVGWGVGGFNPNFAKLEALVHLTVIAVAATPPTTPANGDCYIVAASPTGAWVGHADDIAVYYTTGGWLYIDPAVGIRAFDRAGDMYIRFDGIDWIDEIVPAADVEGPAGAVDGNIAIFDATGKVIRDGGQALPAGLIVGTTDIQILENKVIDGADNSLVVHLDTDVVGNLPIGNLGGGVGASSTTAWFGDGTWKPVTTGGGGGASITVSDAPPASPEVGQMWFDSTTACLFVWYEDSSGGQWVIAVNVGVGGTGGGGAAVLSMSATAPMTASSPTGDVLIGMECPLEIEYGGTGGATAPAALAALGAAPILSPVLLGTPTGPTASPGTSNGQLATTAFVANAFGGAGALSITAGTGITVTPSPLTGVGSVALSVPVAISSGGTGAVSAPAALVALGAAPIDSPVFTGDARSVTPATADNDTSIATTAYVKAQGYVTGGPYLPLAGGTITGNLSVDGKVSVGGNANPALGADAAFTYLYAPDGTGSNRCIALGASAGGGSTMLYRNGVHLFQNAVATQSYAQFDTSGSYNVTGSWTVLSDSAAKITETIQPYRRGLDAVLNLNPITFQYRAGTLFATEDEPSDPIVGLLAHEVEPHIPEMCGITTITIDGEEQEVKTLSPGDLTYVLINAIKELTARIEELEARPPNPPQVQPA
jgi:hypothetical protein